MWDRGASVAVQDVKREERGPNRNRVLDRAARVASGPRRGDPGTHNNAFRAEPTVKCRLFIGTIATLFGVRILGFWNEPSKRPAPARSHFFTHGAGSFLPDSSTASARGMSRRLIA